MLYQLCIQLSWLCVRMPYYAIPNYVNNTTWAAMRLLSIIWSTRVKSQGSEKYGSGIFYRRGTILQKNSRLWAKCFDGQASMIFTRVWSTPLQWASLSFQMSVNICNFNHFNDQTKPFNHWRFRKLLNACRTWPIQPWQALFSWQSHLHSNALFATNQFMISLRGCAIVLSAPANTHIIESDVVTKGVWWGSKCLISFKSQPNIQSNIYCLLKSIHTCKIVKDFKTFLMLICWYLVLFARSNRQRSHLWCVTLGEVI